MIVGVGTDIVDIRRFDLWHTYPLKRLQRVFSKEEVSYSLENKKKSSERFAARFAAKEAFYKALSNSQPSKKLSSLISMLPYISVKNKNGIPHLSIKWEMIAAHEKQYNIHLSIAHGDNIAIAFVVLEES